MSKWKWVMVWLLFITLAIPAAGIADTEGAGDPDQPADIEQPEGGDDEAADGGADDEAADDDFASQAPSYKNAAQAMHAANLAAAATLQPDQKTLDAAGDLDSAREAYDDAKAAADANQDNMALQEACELAEGELLRAREAYAGAVSDLSGVMEKDITQMRQNGMGWGGIAHALGVHPSALGLAKGKKKGMIDPVEGEPSVEGQEDPAGGYSAQNELVEATQRDVKSGWSKGHGLQTHKAESSQKGLGLSKTSQAAANNSGSKGSKSKGASAGDTSASGKTNNGRSKDGSPSNSSSGKSKGSSGNNGKANSNSDKSNNGKANGKNK